MPFKLTNLTPNLSRFGKSSKMEQGESSSANADALKKNKGKKPADGAGPSSPGGSSRSSSSSLTESFLSDSSSESRDIIGRFDGPDAYIKHMAEKEKIRAKNLDSKTKDDAQVIKKNTKAAVKSSKNLLAEIKKDDALFKQKLAKIDKEQAKAVKEQAKAERKLVKEEAKLNKEGKLSERQKQEAKRRYENDLQAEIDASAPPESSSSSSRSNSSDDLRRRAWTSYPSPGNRPEARPTAFRSDSPGSSGQIARTLPESPSTPSGHPVPRSPVSPNSNGFGSSHTSHQEQSLGSPENGSSSTSNLRNTDGVPTQIRTTRETLERNTSPGASTVPSSPFTLSEPTTPSTYTSSQHERDMHEVHVEQDRYRNQQEIFLGRPQNVIPVDLTQPTRPAGSVSNPSLVPRSVVDQQRDAVLRNRQQLTDVQEQADADRATLQRNRETPIQHEALDIGTHTRFLLEIKRNEIAREKFTINTSRGFVTPFVPFESRNGNSPISSGSNSPAHPNDPGIARSLHGMSSRDLVDVYGSINNELGSPRNVGSGAEHIRPNDERVETLLQNFRTARDRAANPRRMEEPRSPNSVASSQLDQDLAQLADEIQRVMHARIQGRAGALNEAGPIAPDVPNRSSGRWSEPDRPVQSASTRPLTPPSGLASVRTHMNLKHTLMDARVTSPIQRNPLAGSNSSGGISQMALTPPVSPTPSSPPSTPRTSGIDRLNTKFSDDPSILPRPSGSGE